MEILLISIFTFFAFYGALHITIEIVSGITQKSRADVTAYTVITVKDCECDVEGIIRAAAWKQLRLASCGNVPPIYAVDLGSVDKTFEILEKLALEYDFLTAFSHGEYIEILNEM